MALPASDVTDQPVGDEATPLRTRRRWCLVAVVLAVFVFLGLGAAAALTGGAQADPPALTFERSGPAPLFALENLRPEQPSVRRYHPGAGGVA